MLKTTDTLVNCGLFLIIRDYENIKKILKTQMFFIEVIAT